MDVTNVAPAYEPPVATPPQAAPEPAPPPPPPAAEKQQSAPASMDVIQKVLEQVNKSITTYNREMNISVHEKTQRIMVKVMDTEKKEVIREIPPEKVLDAFARTLELAGILLDKKR
ncbi:MAG: flagellar protein FlaG [Defluviitaleaceae bacterium]|nr:flagellar protein FlaG [Defluviitaleaceae bacterium]